MESFTAYPDKVRLAIVADVDLLSANVLADRLVPQEKSFDGIICCGPFTHTNEWSKSKEGEALAQGDMASTIASLENTVCRVIYLPAEMDPPSTYLNQLHLTPNSVNIHARRLALRNNLFVSGFTETKENLSPGRIINSEEKDSHEYSDDEYDGVEVKSGASSIQAIESIVKEGHGNEIAAREVEEKSLSAKDLMGIFLLNYRFTHTLNHFLFHMPEILDTAGVGMAVILQAANSVGEAPKLPPRFGNLHIISPPSLRLEGKYVDVELELKDGKWNVSSVTTTS